MQALNELRKHLQGISKYYEVKKINDEIVIKYNEQILCQLHKEGGLEWCLSFSPRLVFPGVYGIKLIKDIIAPVEQFERSEAENDQSNSTNRTFN